jgi:hypothetical protein
MTYILGHVLQNIRLQWHLHVYGAGHPAQLSLPNIEHSFNSLCFLFTNGCTCPSFCGYFINSWFYLGEAQKVHVAILLLVRALLIEDKGLQGLVNGGAPRRNLVRSFAGRIESVQCLLE